MNLESTTAEQIQDLVTWMLEQAELKIPGSAEHAERCLAMKEHAWFLKEISLPKIGVQGRMANLAIAEGVNGLPARPDGLGRENGFLRSKSSRDDREVEARDPVESTSEPLELPAAIPGAIA